MTHPLLCALRASPRDGERLIVWASCGYNARRAARCRPDLGCRSTYSRAALRYQSALVELVRAQYVPCSGDPSCRPS